MQLCVIALLVAWCIVSSTGHPIEISGRILDARGNPLPVAHAELRRPGRLEPLVQVRANPDGSFALRADGEGLYLLRLAGVHHQSLEVPIVVEDAPIRDQITVRLPTLPFPEQRDSVLVVTERALPETTAGILLRNREGIYVLPPGVRLPPRYRLAIRGGGRGVVTAPSTDSLVLAPDGYYSAIARTDSIAFDPAELPRLSSGWQIRCGSAAWQEVADAYSALASYQRAYIDSSNAQLRQMMQGGGVYVEPGQVHERLGAQRWRDTITARLSTVRSPFAERLWLLFALVLPSQGTSDALPRRALQRIPPQSPEWALDPQLVFTALAHRPESERRAYLDELIEKNPDTVARAVVAFTELVSAFTTRDRERARMLYRVLTERCPTHPLARTAERYNPDRRIQVGESLPKFRLTDQRGTAITPNQLSGAPSLIAIVFPQCQPCIERIEELGRWRDSASKRLNVLIISAGKPDTALARTLARVPHTLVVVEGPNAAALEPFEPEGFPTLILADASGIIRATTSQIRNLGSDLERYLQQP
jgi:hypothetical protein